LRPLKPRRYYTIQACDGGKQVIVCWFARKFLLFREQLNWDRCTQQKDESLPEFVGRAHHFGREKTGQYEIALRNEERDKRRAKELQKALKKKEYQTIEYIKQMGEPGTNHLLTTSARMTNWYRRQVELQRLSRIPIEKE
jgi:hypothetical protein